MLNTVLAIESEAFMDGARASRENRLAIEAEAAAPTSPDVVEWFVHNHGPSEGKGTACHEYRVNGRLLGECLLPAQPAGLDVWAVVVGNYFPREVEAIYLHEADAVRHADEHDGRDVVKWTVAAAYAEGEPE
jgi:hypothetical protein